MTTHGSYNIQEFALKAHEEAKRLEAQVDLFWKREAVLLESIGFSDMRLVADIGCASGYYLSLLKKKFPDLSVHGVEIAPLLADAARKRLQSENIEGCEIAEKSAYETGLENDRYDAVVMRLLLEHLEEPDKALAEARRILKPGGLLVLIDNDFAYHERTLPDIPELDLLYEAYCQARRSEGGNPTIGRELPIHLENAGYSISSFEILTAHSALTGDAAFLKAEGSGIPLRLVETGFLAREVLDRLVEKWGGMILSRNHVIYRQLFVACGRKTDENERLENSANARHLPADRTVLQGGDFQKVFLQALGNALSLDSDDLETGKSAFDYGLDSLGAMEVRNAVSSALGLDISISDILSGRPLSVTIAKYRDDSGPTGPVDAPAISPSPQAIEKREPAPGGPYPLSEGQKALYLLHHLLPDIPAYNVAVVGRVVSDLDTDRLRQCLALLEERHSALRSLYAWHGPEPEQRTNERHRPCFETIDASGWSEEDLQRKVHERYAEPFDLEKGPVMRVTLYEASPINRVLLLVVHHIALDGWSLRLLLEELGVLYEAETEGRAPALPAVKYEYSDFVEWQRQLVAGQEGKRQLEYWRNHLLPEPPPLELPADQPRSTGFRHIGASWPFRIESDLYRRVRQTASNGGFTLFSVALSAYQLLLMDLSGQNDIVVGTPAAGRTNADFDRVSGYFMNSVAIRVTLQNDPLVSECLTETRESLLGALENQDYPFPSLVKMLNLRRYADRSPAFQAFFVLNNRNSVGPAVPLILAKQPEFSESATIGPLRLEPYPMKQQEGQFDLTLEFVDTGRTLEGVLKYYTDLFEESTVRKMCEQYVHILERIADNPHSTLSDIGLKISGKDTVSPTDAGISSAQLSAEKQTGRIAIASTFAAEPLESPLSFWMQELGMPFRIEIAPYNQIFQQLLDPQSLFLSEKEGVNIVLIRFEDWLNGETGRSDTPKPDRDESSQHIERTADELVQALRFAVKNSTLPIFVFLCPASAATLQNADQASLFKNLKERLDSEIQGIVGGHFIRPSKFSAIYPIREYDNPLADHSAIPYTPESFVSFATAITRSIHATLSEPYKVVVLDCDGTLWKGVVGEDGVDGLQIGPPHQALQNFFVSLHDTGMLLCLCSKNNADDVFKVFTQRQEMSLKQEHLASYRINWEPKSENIRSLAKEMNLNLDSFIFLDDNPIECADVRSNCPEVTVLELPQNLEEIPRFLDHVWVFDRWNVTEEDKNRTRSYQEKKDRDQLRKESLTLQEFLTGLEIRAHISPIAISQIARASQLTLRTNQFNTTTIRRSENDLQALLDSPDHDILVVEVQDRFGNYGIVGLIVFQAEGESLKTDTFLLSCRALGRGVEHQMLAKLGRVALERGKQQVEVLFRPTRKNQPALKFLEQTRGRIQKAENDELRYSYPASCAAEILFAPEDRKPSDANDQREEKNGSELLVSSGKKTLWIEPRSLQRIATDLSLPGRILEMIRSRESKTRQFLEHRIAPYVPPRTETERIFAAVWREVLQIEQVGVEDNFFDLGGHSILIPEIIEMLHKAHGLSISMIDMFQYPTISAVAAIVDHKPSTATPSDENFQNRADKRRAALQRKKERRGEP